MTAKQLAAPRRGGGFLIFDFRFLIGMLASLLLAAAPGRAGEPTALELLQSVRLGQGAQHRVLKGELQCAGKVTPFRLVLNGNEIRYEFTNPDQVYALKLGERTSQLDLITKNGTEHLTGARLAEPVRGTSVTCEDLALRFLYWPNAKFLAEDSIGPIRYYTIELRPDPDSGSQYGRVVVWVAKKLNGVLGKAECYSPDGKQRVVLMKVISSKSLEDGTRFLEEMTIERTHAGESSDKDRTSLLIVGEEK